MRIPVATALLLLAACGRAPGSGPLGLAFTHGEGCVVTDVESGTRAGSVRQWALVGEEVGALFRAACEEPLDVELRAPAGSRARPVVRRHEWTDRTDFSTGVTFRADAPGTYVLTGGLNNEVHVRWEVFDVPALVPVAQADYHVSCEPLLSLSGTNLLCGHWWWSVDAPTLHVVGAYPRYANAHARVVGDTLVSHERLAEDDERLVAHRRSAPEELAASVPVAGRTRLFASRHGRAWSATAGTLTRLDVVDGRIEDESIALGGIAQAPHGLLDDGNEVLFVAIDRWQRFRASPLELLAAGVVPPRLGGIPWDAHRVLAVTGDALERVELETGRRSTVFALAPLRVVAMARPFVVLQSDAGAALVLEEVGEELVPRARVDGVRHAAAAIDGRRMAMVVEPHTLAVFAVPE